MALALHLLLGGLFSVASGFDQSGSSGTPLAATWKDGRRGVEIDGGNAMMRRSLPPTQWQPAAALEDMEDGISAGTRDRSGFRLTSAVSAASASGLLATLQSLGAEGKKPPPLGSMVLLVDSESEVEMRSLEEVLVPSLISSLKFRTPITVLFSGPSEPVEDATIKLNMSPFIALSLVDVTLRVDQFAQQAARKNGHQKKQGKNWKLNEFWAMHVHLLPELQHVHYAWRLSPKSSLTGDVTTDLYEVMRKQKAVFGYRLLRNEHLKACAGLQGATEDFYKENAEYAPQSLNARAFLNMYEQAQCPLWTSDFQLVDLDYLRQSEAYTDYIQYISDIGGFAKFDWAVPSVQTLLLATQEAPERMLCMSPWVPSYHGESDVSCGEGMDLTNFFRSTAKDQFAQAEAALQVEEVFQNPTQTQPVASKSAKEVSRRPVQDAAPAVTNSGSLTRLVAWLEASVGQR